MKHMFDEYIDKLESSGNYRVLKKLDLPTQYHEHDETKRLIGAIVDTETTGLSHENDKVIELGIVLFEFDREGKIYHVMESYQGFQDPEEPLSEEVIKITGITDDMVNGQSFDIPQIEGMIDRCALIIAHNARFDRPFCEGISGLFSEKHWACSMTNIDWTDVGIGARKLDYIAYQFGFYFDAHRATVDCEATLHILSKTLPETNELALAVLLKNARVEILRVWAVNSPFETKDVLKDRGYRWGSGDDGFPKAWYIDIPSQEYESELTYLNENIYSKKVGDLPAAKITAKNRFTDRLQVEIRNSNSEEGI